MKSQDLFIKGTSVAFWSWHIPTDTLTLGGKFTDFLGCLHSELPSSFEQTKSFFSEEDFEEFKREFQRCQENPKSPKLQVQTSHRSAEVKQPFDLHWSGEIIQWEENEPILMVGQANQEFQQKAHNLPPSEQTEFFKLLMEHLPDSIFFKDQESRFIAINNACAKKFGISNPEEAVGKTDFDFFDEIHAQQALDDEIQVMESGEPIIRKIEKEVRTREANEVFWASTSKLPMYDEDGNVIGTFGITQDITNQYKAEKELERKEATFSKLSKQVPGFFYLYRFVPEGESFFPYASHGIKEIFELNPEDVKESADPVFNRIHPEDAEKVQQAITKSVETLETWNIDFRLVLPEKGLRWVRGKAKPEKQADGSIIGYGYIMDVTEEKKKYRLSTLLRKQLQQVIDSAPNLIFVKDLDGKYLMANKSAADFFGESPKTIIGKTGHDLGIPEEKVRAYAETEKQVIEENESHFTPEDKTALDDGSEVWHQTIKVPFLNTESGKPAVLSIVTDITKRKKNELELSKSLDFIGEQNQRLSNFAHIVSHNLRNHAGNISMLLSLYNSEESAEEKEELLEHLNTASNRLNDSIADLNEIIDKQYNNKGLLKELDLHETLSKTKEILTTEILANNVQFEEDIPSDLSFKYNPAYLESIMLNLISNAIKYRHPDRKPVIKIKARKENDNVFLEISDNGLGIDLKKNRDKLFGMYKTFHGNENAKGIGLFITKNQIESLGGSIDVESEPGEGTTFKIRLT